MKTKWEILGALSLMLSMPLLSLFYDVLNNGERGVSFLITDLDRGMPFAKIFVLPYVAWFAYIFFVFVYLCLKDRRIYYKTLITYNIGVIACYVVYFFFQTTVPRPFVEGDDFLARMVLWVYSSDQPYNCFPSIHSFASFIMIKAISKSTVKNKFNTTVIYGMSSLIIISTLLIKQHVILDAFSAILLGDVVFKLVYRFDREALIALPKRIRALTAIRKKAGSTLDIS